MLDSDILAEYNAFRHCKNPSIFCHAPFTSINFAQNGDVTVCCYNRQHILGTYPENSLQEIWTGDSAAKLRALLRHNTLPNGCWICTEQFRSRNFGGMRARFYDHFAEETYGGVEGDITPWPKVLEFEITNTCNLECTMCNGFSSSAIRKHREHLPPLKSPYDAAFVKQLEPFIPHLREARFLGGEPFLINIYYKIWDLIAQVNPDIDVTIVTNGTILNDKVRRTLESLKAHVNISIDALNPDNYERIRVNAKFDQVMDNFRYFRDYVAGRQTSMTLNVCPMRSNWHELPDFLEFCNGHGIRLFFNTVLYPEEVSLRGLPQRELTEILDFLRTVDLPHVTPNEADNRRNYLDLLHQIGRFRDQSVDYDEFDEVDLAGSDWSLHTRGGDVADLVETPADPQTARIVIAKAESQVPWNIQLNRAKVRIEPHRRYVIMFRARATGRRSICFGVAPAEAPCEQLGRHKTVQLTPEWQDFDVGFESPRSGDARFHFNLGGNDAAVELSNVTLRCFAVP